MSELTNEEKEIFIAVVELQKVYARGVTPEEIAEKIEDYVEKIRIQLEILEEKGYVVHDEYDFDGNIQSLYRVNIDERILEVMTSTINQEFYRYEKKISRLEEKLIEVEQREKRFYTETVSIIGVFSATLALIITSINVIQSAITMNLPKMELFIKMLIMTMPVVLSVFCLLFFLINIDYSAYETKKE